MAVVTTSVEKLNPDKETLTLVSTVVKNDTILSYWRSGKYGLRIKVRDAKNGESVTVITNIEYDMLNNLLTKLENEGSLELSEISKIKNRII